jgi:hypothetical protein
VTALGFGDAAFNSTERSFKHAIPVIPFPTMWFEIARTFNLRTIITNREDYLDGDPTMWHDNQTGFWSPSRFNRIWRSQ